MVAIGFLRRYAPLRKRFAFVAGNDERLLHFSVTTPASLITFAHRSISLAMKL
jgi:hypothetical protein